MGVADDVLDPLEQVGVVCLQDAGVPRQPIDLPADSGSDLVAVVLGDGSLATEGFPLTIGREALSQSHPNSSSPDCSATATGSTTAGESFVGSFTAVETG